MIEKSEQDNKKELKKVQQEAENEKNRTKYLAEEQQIRDKEAEITTLKTARDAAVSPRIKAEKNAKIAELETAKKRLEKTSKQTKSKVEKFD